MELYIYSALILAILVQFVILAVFYRRLGFLQRRYCDFMSGHSSGNLEDILIGIVTEQRQIHAKIIENKNIMQEIIEVVNTSVRGIGVVRFNAFQDTGSDLSFALAFLDAHGNGMVLSSIYGREESRTYAKPIEDGKSSYQLSVEEKDAISRALQSMRPFSAE